MIVIIKYLTVWIAQRNGKWIRHILRYLWFGIVTREADQKGRKRAQLREDSLIGGKCVKN